MTDIDTDKAVLRAELRARRRRLKDADPEAPFTATQAFAAVDLPPFAAVALYHPVGAEMDPRPLGAMLAFRGVRLAYPVVVARDAPLIFRAQNPGAPLVPDAIGILSPGPDAPEIRPDLIVAPMLAFDATGARMGQGGGYYDRTLAALRSSAPVFALGLGYAGQEVEALPVGPYDQRLDAVLTENGLRLFDGDDGE